MTKKQAIRQFKITEAEYDKLESRLLILEDKHSKYRNRLKGAAYNMLSSGIDIESVGDTIEVALNALE